ncbi:MAG: DUF4249 domain-containing protein [Bacteroidota bacterium]
MRIFKNLLLLGTLVLIAASCEKVIDIEVDDTEPKTVIEANYRADLERVDVKITETRSVFSAEEFPVVTGASVEIIDAGGTATALTDQGDGTYLLENYTPDFGSEYTMRVTIGEEEYEGKDVLPPVVPIDSLTLDFEEESLFGDAGYVVYVNFTDPSGPNFYRANRVVNGDSLTSLGAQFLFDDSFSEGNNQAVPFFSSRYEAGDSIQVSLLSYSEKTFNYYDELFEITSDNSQNAAPANPTPTWTNEALGNFATYGADTALIVVEE